MTSDENHLEAISHLLGERVVSLRRIREGRNSRVLHVTCSGPGKYIVKYYFTHEGDSRDRLGNEYGGIEFMWRNGIRSIPRPILMRRDLGCAVYGYVEGSKIEAGQTTEADIDRMIDFALNLKRLSFLKESLRLPTASEACFTIEDILRSIDFRLARLSRVDDSGSEADALRRFLTTDFRPAFDEVRDYCLWKWESYSKQYGNELCASDRTLSPSDFGFHNALRTKEGEIVFLDFEYFGWDDPAKLVSDFILHPGMEIRLALRRRFAAGLFAKLDHGDRLARRAAIVCALFGVKWGLILLNEFVPSDMKRREFASQHPEKTGIRSVQLEKAKRMVRFVKENLQEFPSYMGVKGCRAVPGSQGGDSSRPWLCGNGL